MAYVREVTKLTIRSTTLAYIDYFYQSFSTGLHGVVDVEVDFEPMGLGFESRESLFFIYLFFYVFFVIIITVQIQHYCLYSVSPTLLLLMMPRPPAPSAL